jgi:protein-disulfide isomerase
MYTFHVAANCGGHRKDSPGKCTLVLRDVPLDNDTATAATAAAADAADAAPHDKNKVSVIQTHSHTRAYARAGARYWISRTY